MLFTQMKNTHTMIKSLSLVLFCVFCGIAPLAASSGTGMPSSATVGQDSACNLMVTVVSLTPDCSGSSSGSVTIMVTGGAMPFTHEWSPGNATGETVTGLSAGVYTVSTTDANQCQTETTITIPSADTPSVVLSLQSAACPGVPNGTALAVVSPAGTYSFSWNIPGQPLQDGAVLSGLAAGSEVAVTVTDPATGCSSSASGSIGALDQIQMVVTDTDIACAGLSLGAATVNASANSPQIFYEWTSPPGDSVISNQTQISNLSPGSYQIEVTDLRGCRAIEVVDITVGGAPHAAMSGLQLLECGSDSSLIRFENFSTDAFSSIASWEWRIVSSDTSYIFPNVSPLVLWLPAGDTITVSLGVVSANGCTNLVSRTMFVPENPDVELSTGATAFNCDNSPVTISVSGGKSYYQYIWSPLSDLAFSPSPVNVVVNPDSTTSYQLIANDRGCTDTVSVNVIRVRDINLQANDSEVHSCDSLYVLTASADVNGVIWVDAAGNPAGTPPSDTVTVNAGVTAVYTAIAIGDLGCADSVSVSLTGSFVGLVADPAKNGIGCEGEPLQLGVLAQSTVTNFTWQWQAPPSLTLSDSNIANPTVTGPTGSYVVTVTVSNSYCSQTLLIPVSIQNNPSLDQAISANLCDGLQTQFFNNSSVGGIWTFGDGTQSEEMNPAHVYASAGSYQVTFTPYNTVCVDPWDTTVVVSATALVQPEIGGGQVSCIGSMQFQFTNYANSQGVVNWSWTFEGGNPAAASNAAPYVSFNSEGEARITLTLTDANGCITTDDTTIQIIIVSDNIPELLKICPGDSVSLNNDGFDTGAVYAWTAIPADPELDTDNPDPVVSPGVSTNYEVTISQGLCKMIRTVEVVVLPSPVLEADPSAPASGCAGVPFVAGVVSQPPADTYQWSALPPLILTASGTDHPTISGPAGSYMVTVTATVSSGCSDTLAIPVEIDQINDQIAASATICAGSEVALNADGTDPNATYNWSSTPFDADLAVNSPNPAVSPDVSTVYSVSVSSGVCSISQQVNVTVEPVPSVKMLPDSSLISLCSETESLQLSALGSGMIYEWSDNAGFTNIIGSGTTLNLLPPIAEGKYYVRTILGICEAVDSVRIDMGTVSFAVNSLQQQICYGESASLIVQNLNPGSDLSYVWTPSLPGEAVQEVSPGITTQYHVAVTDSRSGCTKDTTFTVEVISVGVNAGIIGKDTLFYGESTTVQAIATGNGTMFTYEWSPSDGLSDPYSATTEAAPEADIIYTVTVTSASGCTATDEVEVFYRGGLCEEPFIFVPKAFTPNNDSNNDFFIIRGVNIVELEFVVWSRWGEKVYQTTDVNAQGWDGTYKGAELTPDSYAWYARVRCGNGAVYENKGDVTLLK
ncbi:MAG: hypothetical protein RJA20_512 [Bacteroidota bacterium]